MPYYIPDLSVKTSCVGNTLSTFNMSFSSLDTNLFDLSSYSVSSINFLSATMVSVSSTLASRVNFLSSTMVSVSSDLRTQIFNTSSFLLSTLNSETDYLSSQIQFVSANVIPDYTRQGTLTNDNGIINWTISSVGHNASMVLSSPASLQNPVGLVAGDSGNLVVNISVSSGLLTAFGSTWTFAGQYSTINTNVSAKNLISYYYDGTYLLSNLISFDL